MTNRLHSYRGFDTGPARMYRGGAIAPAWLLLAARMFGDRFEWRTRTCKRTGYLAFGRVDGFEIDIRTNSTVHFHVCEACRKYWSHERLPGLAPDVADAYHRCPYCGAGPYRFAYDSVRDAMTVVRYLRDDEPPASAFSIPENSK